MSNKFEKMGLCTETRAWPKKPKLPEVQEALPASSPSSSFSVILRTSYLTSQRLSSCTRGYLQLLRTELVRFSVGIHLLTDLSLWAPQGTLRALRSFADAHEAWLRAQLPGVEPFAFTVGDLVSRWPGVHWPVPGDVASRPLDRYDSSTQSWLRYVHRSLQAQGNLSRHIDGEDGLAGVTVSNLVSYYIHEPSICLWMRRRPRSERFVWVLEEDAPLLGSISVPFRRYTSSRADLVSVFMKHQSISTDMDGTNILPAVSGSGSLSTSASPTGGRTQLWVNSAFHTALPGATVHKWEHVERLSLSLLGTIDELLARGAAAFGEVFASTVCNQTASCTCEDLRDRGFVQRQGYNFAWSHPLTRHEIKRLLKIATPKSTKEGRGLNRWLHGVVGDCDVLAVATCASRGNAGNECTLPAEGASAGLWSTELQRIKKNHAPRPSKSGSVSTGVARSAASLKYQRRP